MTVIQPLTFDADRAPVLVTTSTGTVYTALTIDWNYPRANWAAPTGLMLEIQDPAANAPVGQKLRVFVPWNSIRFITQIIPLPDPGV